jgi:hypothetical protein
MKMIMTATDEEIIKYIKQLINSFGIRGTISGQTLEKLRGLHQSGQPSKCIAEIKSILRLGFTIKVGYMNSVPDLTNLKNFVIKHYPELNNKELDVISPKKLSMAGAFAVIPPHLPLYGTLAFDNFKVLMFISRQIMDDSFEAFVYSVAHELAHFVLFSTRHPLQNNEVAVDLTAMILGFLDIIRVGRKSKGTINGYLDDHGFQIAYREISRRNQVIYL